MSTLFGCIVSNDKDEVLHYAEKPETFVSDVVNTGVYVLNSEVINNLGQIFHEHEFVFFSICLSLFFFFFYEKGKKIQGLLPITITSNHNNHK